jgi:excisionase family DNA binding protein
MSSLQPLTLSVREAAAFVGCGRTNMHELIQTKRIKVHMMGTRIRVLTTACEQFVASLPDHYVKGEPVPPAAPKKAKKSKARKAVRQ